MKRGYFEKAYEKGLIHKGEKFLALNLYQWENYSKFIIQLEKEIKSEKSIRAVILLTAIALEKVLNMIFIKIYDMDRYEKFDSHEVLSQLNLNAKIKLIGKIKKRYKRKQPKNSRYKPACTMTVLFFKKLQARYGKDVAAVFEEIEEEICRENGIKKPSQYANLLKPIKLKWKTSSDYLSDDVIDFLKNLNCNEIDRIRGLRNIVSHEWDYKKALSKKLRINSGDLNGYIRRLCLAAVSNAAQISI